MSFQVDLSDTEQGFVMPVETVEQQTPKRSRKKVQQEEVEEETFVNCLQNKTVIVRFVLKEHGNITNPKHVLYGGMAETATRFFVVPMSKTGSLINPLTQDEQKYLEHILGYEEGYLNAFKRKDNYWTSDNFKVRLTKQDNLLDLSNPDDYIKYKVLLLNSDEICPSMQELLDAPKATYQFVIVDEEIENNRELDEMNVGMKASMLLGKILSEPNKIRLIVQILAGKPIAKTSSEAFLKKEAYKYIQANPKMFIAIAEDKYIDTKVFIQSCVEAGIIKVNGNFYYDDNMNPLAPDNAEPTFTNAAIFLNQPRNQSLKLKLEAKLKQ